MTAGSSRALLVAAALAFGCDGDDDAADGTVDSAEDGAEDASDDAAADGAEDADDGADDGADDAAGDTGQVALRFEVGSTVSSSMNLEDELSGHIYGGIFLTSDVSVTGPRDDAMQFAAVEALDIDLTADGAVSDVTWTSEGLEPGNYTFLGYFDVDGSSDELEEKDPEAGDPVTLPTVNKFTIETGATAELTVRFDLVFS